MFFRLTSLVHYCFLCVLVAQAYKLFSICLSDAVYVRGVPKSCLLPVVYICIFLEHSMKLSGSNLFNWKTFTGCGPNRFGKYCQHRCSNEEDGSCKDKLFCLPDPFGCTCAAGFSGIICSYGKTATCISCEFCLKS